MKRKILIGAVVTALIYICVVLNTKIIDPADFTGTWYRSTNGLCYIFENGIIQCSDEKIIHLNGDVFSGAYTFMKDKAAIFVVDDHGVGEVVELVLVQRADGDILCEQADGVLVPWFSRRPVLTYGF